MRVVVLNDGETYTSAEGCMILDIEDDCVELDDLDEVVKLAHEFFTDNLDQTEERIIVDTNDGVEGPIVQVIARLS